MLDNFVEYLLKSILEADGSDNLPVYFSDRFRGILQEIINETDNEVAQRLLMNEGEKGKRVYIDIDDESIDKVSFLMANKAEEILGKDDLKKYLSVEDYNKVYKARQRGTMKINRFVNNLYNNEYQTKTLTDKQKEFNKERNIKTPSQLLEDFVNQFKMLRQPGEFELVKGDDIQKWYSEDYYENENGQLGSSCMKYEECQNYLDIYVFNQHKISMLIMKSRKEEDKIVGRAIVWKLDLPEDRIFMDRIYTNYEHDVDSFKKYAKEQGWLYKIRQNMESDEKTYDSKLDEASHIDLVVKNIEPPQDDPLYPYMDTMKYYAVESYEISNNLDYFTNELIYRLEGTSGDDFYKMNRHSIEELREIYYDDIISDIEYYVINHYPESFWDYIKDEKYIKEYKKGEVNYYLEDFDHLFDDEDVLKTFIKDNVDENNIPKDFEDLEFDELSQLMENLNIKADFVIQEIDNRYSDYTAKDLHEELYGNVDDITSEIFQTFEYYFKDEDFAEYVSETEDEEYLRERYPDDED